MTVEETPRQRFIRNSEENARIVRARQRQFEQAGDFETANKLGEIQDKWDKMHEEAVRQETELNG